MSALLPKADIKARRLECLLSANSGHGERISQFIIPSALDPQLWLDSENLTINRYITSQKMLLVSDFTPQT